MNRSVILSAIAVIILGVFFLSWHNLEPKISPAPDKTNKTVAQQAQVNQMANEANAIATAAGQVAASQPLPPATTPTANVAAPTNSVAASSATASGKPGKIVEPELSPEDLAEIHKEVKEAIETKFKDKLSFPLDEAKMIAYAQASLKVKKINNKWDVQIAGGDSDKLAIEYNNLAVEEITKSMQSIPGLTLDQYNEMTKLTATNKEFSQVYQVYMKLLEEGIIQTTASAAPLTTNPVVSAPVVAAPTTTAPIIAAPTTAAKPVAAQGVPGTVPVTQGSPKPPYSQQPSH